ncbi:MAG: c-type cytochrome [Bacteroidia bacterium]|nr:c-type cytochrome [Bacteroidia bacterium]
MKHLKYLLFLSFLSPIILIGKSTNTSLALDWAFENIIFLLAFMVIIYAFSSLWGLAKSMMDYKIQEITGESGINTSKNEPSFFKKIYDRAWKLIPMDKEEDIDLGHDYDGIRELDNSLPPWWLYTFYLTIVWGIGYIYVYHISDLGLDQHSEYLAEIEIAEEAKRNFLASQEDNIDETNVIFLDDAASLQAGKERFITSCAVCHGPDGQGGIGANLTDKYWIHGGGIKDIFKTIKYGVPEKGMIAWKTQLQPASIQKLASYVVTLQGTDPPNQKAPQGEIWEGEDPTKIAMNKEEE